MLGVVALVAAASAASLAVRSWTAVAPPGQAVELPPQTGKLVTVAAVG
jgi:hypothetical protein